MADDERRETLLEQMGGLQGLLYSTLPILVFVPVNAIWHLRPALYAALGAAAAILVWRLVRREKIQPAVSAFIGVAICAFIAHRTGTAKGYFLYGIYTSLVYGGAFVVSVLVRWPLVGVIWNMLNGVSSEWRKVRRARTLYDVATIGWAVVFGARYLVQSQLYDADQTGWLAFARIVMGWPLAAAALLVTFVAIRKADAAVRSVYGDVAEGGADLDEDGADVAEGGVDTAEDGADAGQAAGRGDRHGAAVEAAARGDGDGADAAVGSARHAGGGAGAGQGAGGANPNA